MKTLLNILNCTFRQFHRYVILALSALVILNTACEKELGSFLPVPHPVQEEDSGTFVLIPAYDSIRSYPGGGGIFVFGIDASLDFSGSVKLSYNADPLLRAHLSKIFLFSHDSVAEITIKPVETLAPGTYTIRLNLTHGCDTLHHDFQVHLFQWQGQTGTMASQKLNEFKSWLLQHDQAFSNAFITYESQYSTYPEILIVEHFTFLTSLYEVRICYHVMIPPYDWSMVRLRKRNTLEPIIAARRETNGTISQIGISEYPTFFGY